MVLEALNGDGFMKTTNFVLIIADISSHRLKKILKKISLTTDKEISSDSIWLKTKQNKKTQKVKVLTVQIAVGDL